MLNPAVHRRKKLSTVRNMVEITSIYTTLTFATVDVLLPYIYRIKILIVYTYSITLSTRHYGAVFSL